MKIREATKHDLDEIIDLWKKTSLSIKEKGRDKKSNLQNQLKQPNMWLLLAEEKSSIIGVVLVTHDTRKGWINRLAVQPDKRRQKIASKLLEEAEKTLLENGIQIFAALIEDQNSPSKKFFFSTNYKQHKDISYFPKRLSDEI
ncbi:MAG: GNAT family N-acetyltransferase [Asgard group archaeon]|nr:GNAT family N-acetyltransferase [Asgard group archaeon]